MTDQSFFRVRGADFFSHTIARIQRQVWERLKNKGVILTEKPGSSSGSAKILVALCKSQHHIHNIPSRSHGCVDGNSNHSLCGSHSHSRVRCGCLCDPSSTGTGALHFHLDQYLQRQIVPITFYRILAVGLKIAFGYIPFLFVSTDFSLDGKLSPQFLLEQALFGFSGCFSFFLKLALLLQPFDLGLYLSHNLLDGAGGAFDRMAVGSRGA